eukprot:CAMPEP_0174694064 /NCGR_PEP_ID=MMETSP1094-20130205/703_1 /TAXON_ID=156173 /ORGANISM="Chrysochromulina brevifilum, Strain UTEX LB 985" /LENGTH=279 /DNA_ID=CAMNT_0015890187 /DNA_START=194 /DNA_END=1034 /DNA_ORIENTATION=-
MCDFPYAAFYHPPTTSQQPPSRTALAPTTTENVAAQLNVPVNPHAEKTHDPTGTNAENVDWTCRGCSQQSNVNLGDCTLPASFNFCSACGESRSGEPNHMVACAPPKVIGAALHAMRYSQNHLSGVSSADALLVHRHRRQRTPAAAVTSPWHRRSISALIAELPRVSGEILPSSASLLAPLTATGRVGSAARTSQAHFGSAASVAAVSHLGHHAESARCERDAVRCAFSPARSRGFQAWPHGGCRVCNADGILHARQERASRQCDCCAPVTWHGVYAHE